MHTLNIPGKGRRVLLSAQSFRQDITDHYGNIVYENGKKDKMLFDGGYVTFDGGVEFHYYTSDYLGSTRAVVSGTDGSVEQFTSYYAFGGIIPELSTSQDTQPYKYNGKEFDRHHGLDLYDHGARRYDPLVPGGFQSTRSAKKARHISPYVMCNNNTIVNYDPDGRFPRYLAAWLDKAEHIFCTYGPIVEDLRAKNKNYRYYYLTAEMSDGDIVVTAHQTPSKRIVPLLQTGGDVLVLTGELVCPFNPALGASIVATGKGVSGFGTLCDYMIDYCNDQFDCMDFGIDLVKIGVDTFIDNKILKFLPGAKTGFNKPKNYDKANTILHVGYETKLYMLDRSLTTAFDRHNENDENDENDEDEDDQ